MPYSRRSPVRNRLVIRRFQQKQGELHRDLLHALLRQHLRAILHEIDDVAQRQAQSSMVVRPIDVASAVANRHGLKMR